MHNRQMSQNDLYIYYSVAPADASRHRVALQKLTRRVEQDYRIRCTLRFRRDPARKEDTWMEVWHAVSPGFEHFLLPLATESGAAACISGQRHYELFQEPPEPV